MNVFRKNAIVSPILLQIVVLLIGTPLLAAERRFERTEIHMGTSFTIILYAHQPDQASSAFDNAFERIAELDAMLSNYKSESELNRLCRSAAHANPVRVSDDLFRVLSESKRYYRTSHGAFDVTIGPVSRLWRRARRMKKMPDPDRLAATMKLVGSDQMILDAKNKTVQLKQAKMKIDLGAIAKGYAIDQALSVIGQSKIKSALVDGGGDVAVSGPPEGRKFWKVQIAHSSKKTPVCLHLVHQAVATSGDLYQFVQIDGVRYSHIIDPLTGIGTTKSVATTIVAPNATQADALASMFSVLGSPKSQKLISQFKETEGRWLERFEIDSIKTFESSRFQSFLVDCNSEKSANNGVPEKSPK